MKKLVVLLATALLFATPALALIAGSKHDLSSTGPGITSDTDETCVFCHTPHGAGAALTAPLWNRSTVNATGVYLDPAGTMDATPTTASVNASDAILCLSCHDGASLSDPLNNPPNALGGADPTLSSANITGNGVLGTDLSNDHPIGFTFDAALVAADGELNDKATIEGTAGMAGAVSFGNTDDQMWCSSCHDVHGVAGVNTFLRISNAKSALCTTCHIK